MPIIPQNPAFPDSSLPPHAQLSSLKSRPILVSSAELVIEGKASDQQAAPRFSKGRVLHARVLDVLSGRQAMLRIDGKNVLAKTFIPLKAGEEIRVQVFQTGEQPVLRLVQDTEGKLPEAFQGLLKSWGGGSGPFGHLGLVLKRGIGREAFQDGSPGAAAFSRLQQMVAAISLKSETAVPRFLNDLIRGSGLLWENKLLSVISAGGGLQNSRLGPLIETDIKGLALQLLATEFGDGPIPEGLKAFLNGIEYLQLFNQYADEESGRYLLPLPVLLDADIKFGQMLLILGDGKNRSEREDSRRVTVSFILTLSQLGELRADFSVLDRTVAGAFSVATEEIQAFVLHHLSELNQKLQANGYDVLNIGCRVVEPALLAETALFDKAIAGAYSSVLNLVI